MARDDAQPRELRQRRQDVVDEAGAEIVLLGVAAHVFERQHGDGRLFRRRRGGGALARGRVAEPQVEDAHGPRNVLQARYAGVDGPRVYLALGLAPRVLGDGDAAGLADAFDASGDIDPVAHQVAVGFLDDVAEVDADAQFDAALRRGVGVARGYRGLDVEGAADSVHHAAEFNQRAVAGALDDAFAVGGDGGIDHLAA
jgi:hypothetical protein